ncbi:MAG: HAD-IIIC family phosphatase, partial [Actinobacteria bacterium]|nr:HAD-IIIC family phosphatase [Actinomycetota bacterium]
RKLGRLLADLQPTDDGLRPVRLSVLATCTVGPFEPLLRTGLVAVGALPSITVGDYGSFEFSLASGAFAADGEPDVLACLMEESFFLPGDWNGGDVEAVTEHLRARFAEFRSLIESVTRRSTATLVLHTLPLPVEVRESFVSWRAKAALAAAWSQLNADLLGLAAEYRQVLVVDLVSELAEQPVPVRDARLHRYADLPYTDGALHVLARQVARIVQARLGLSRKVLALDLDNTLWGGVLGEVGATGVELGGLYPGSCYRNLQRSTRRLREQGVILVLASKNDAEIVSDALGNHPEMLLRSDAFSVTAVNWSPKADNLRQAAESLSLATGSFVFMDDSPFERGQVASELPEVALVAADGDPSHLVRSLLAPGWFDVLDLTETDRDRPALYRTRALRNEFEGSFGTSEDYLQALNISLEVEPITPFGVARVAQMAARTNQFNLTGIRFDEARTAAMASDPGHLVASLSVSDRFGDEGVVGALWVECGADTWRVLNMVLSCRVLSRGIELAAVDWLARRASDAGATTLQGSFVPSAKNGAAAGFWKRAGFAPADSDGTFTLDLRDGWDPAPSWITQPDRERATR